MMDRDEGSKEAPVKKKKGWNWRNWPCNQRTKRRGVRRCRLKDMPSLRLRVKIKRLSSRKYYSRRVGVVHGQKGIFDLYRRNYWGQWNVIARFDNEEDAVEALAKELGVDI